MEHWHEMNAFQRRLLWNRWRNRQIRFGLAVRENFEFNVDNFDAEEDAPRQQAQRLEGTWRLPPPRHTKYDEETRNAAIQRVREGVSYSVIARDIDRHCNKSTIARWVAKARAQGLLPQDTVQAQPDALAQDVEDGQ